jgi:hypothetical protein
MTAPEAMATGKFVAPGKDEAPVFRTVLPTGPLSFRLGKDKRVEEIRFETSRPCFLEGHRRIVDLTSKESQNWAPFADCGGFVTAARTGWVCDEHGIDVLWDGAKNPIVVRRPSAIQPYTWSPAPLPKLPVAAPKPSAKDAGLPDGAVAEEPLPDPCAGNWARISKLSCGFFGRGDALTLECYPVELCMGTFAKEAPRHADLHGANGESLGAFELGRGGRTLAFKFGKKMATGTPVRIYFDRLLKVLPPPTSYLGPDVPEDPTKDPKVVGIAMAAVVGSREVPSGWVLDLVVPASAAGLAKPAPQEKP